MPEAIVAFLESMDFEDAIRNAVSLGGDADTLTCITGGVPEPIASQVWQRLDLPLRQMIETFRKRYSLP